MGGTPAFSQAIIRTTLDSEIKLGTDWRIRLEEALSDADVLLIVATGRQKLSHSYTGYEVGFFSASRRDREKMRHFDSERLIIPIGILEKIPEALSDIESLNLTGTLTPFLVDEDTLKNKQRFLASVETDAAKNPLLKLFMRLKEVVQTLHPFDDDLTEDFKRRARESANRLCLTFFDEFQKRVAVEMQAFQAGARRSMANRAASPPVTSKARSAVPAAPSTVPVTLAPKAGVRTLSVSIRTRVSASIKAVAVILDTPSNRGATLAGKRCCKSALTPSATR
jgi:hypothetical protein